MNSPLWSVILILVLLWALGLGFHIGGSLVHTLLVLALVVFILDVLRGRGLL